MKEAKKVIPMNSDKKPRKPATSAKSKKPEWMTGDYWRAQLAGPSFTGLTASAILCLMNYIGMLHLHWVVLIIPAAAGMALGYAMRKKQGK